MANWLGRRSLSLPCAIRDVLEPSRSLSTPLTHMHTPILALAPSTSNSDRRRRCCHADSLTPSIFRTNEHRPELCRAEPHLLCPFPSQETHWNPTATADRRRPPHPSTLACAPPPKEFSAAGHSWPPKHPAVGGVLLTLSPFFSFTCNAHSSSNLCPRTAPPLATGPSHGRSAVVVFYLRTPTSISATATSPAPKPSPTRCRGGEQALPRLLLCFPEPQHLLPLAGPAPPASPAVVPSPSPEPPPRSRGRVRLAPSYV
jgi:hypothetical protein